MPKTPILVCSTVVLLLLAVVMLNGQTAANRNPAATTAGRYQLISSPYSIWMKDGTTTTETTAFKIDTATGKAWKYETGQDAQGHSFEHWGEIADMKPR